ncbi:MAG TPA: PA2169 family four-helix-bundle protein [Vicinamibacterales bacterium]|nr:PA2169 family four-helix-bundle protein [Vicinamibacterales bacterium]
MSDHSERWVLNRLIEMCKDEEESLRHIADQLKDPQMKSVMSGLADRRALFASELVPHAQRLGGSEAHDGTARGAWHRRWRAIRDMWAHQDDRSLIAEAEQEEQRVLAMYGGALDQIFPPGTRKLIETQASEIRRDCGQVQAYLTH